jgi:hypothetical protein
MSASAYLGFGVIIGSEDDGDSLVYSGLDLDTDEGWAQREVIEELGPYDLHEIIAVRSMLADGFVFTDYEDDYDAYSAHCKEITDEWGAYGKNMPVETMSGGTYEYSVVALVLNDDRFRGHAYWGAEAVEVEQPTDDDIAAAAEFCKRYNLPSFENPKWILAAHYG